MSTPEPTDWLASGITDARLRRLMNRRYMPDTPNWVRAVQYASVGLVILFAGFTVLALPARDALMWLEFLGGVIVLNIALVVWNHLVTANSYVEMTPFAVVHRTPLMKKVIAWEDVASTAQYAVARGSVSYSNFGLIVYSRRGPRIVINDYYDARQIDEDIAQVLEIMGLQQETELPRGGGVGT